jgi:hypothetical protein
MFNFFNKKPKCPIDEKTRIWMEDALLWLMTQFTEQKLLQIQTLTPSKDSFPMELKADEQTANEILKILCNQMDIHFDNIQLLFYNDTLVKVQEDGPMTISTEHYEGELYSSGQYFGKNKEGKFEIAIQQFQLAEHSKLIATLAHELAHVKILGENKLQENDEYLTDLTTVFFGAGIFTANSSGSIINKDRGWEYYRQGYLSQQEWGYALALYSYIRREQDPTWVQFLAQNIQSDFQKSIQYMLANEDKVLI